MSWAEQPACWFQFESQITNPSWATQIWVKALLSPKVEKPNIILSWCAGTVCSASHSSWELLTEGLRCCALLRFVFAHCFFWVAQAFVAHLVQLVRPETPIPQMSDCESVAWQGRPRLKMQIGCQAWCNRGSCRYCLQQREASSAGVRASVCSGPLSTLRAVSRRNYVRNRSLAFTWFEECKEHSSVEANTWDMQNSASSCWGYWMPSMTNWWSWHGWMLEPWGLMCIFDAGAPAFRLWWASNPGAITHLLTCWIEHNNSLDPRGQTIVLGASLNVFNDLDWGALHLKQMFAAEIIRLETESHHPSAQNKMCLLFCIGSRRSDHWPAQQVPQTHVLARYASLPFGLKAAPELRHEKVPETLTWQCFSLSSVINCVQQILYLDEAKLTRNQTLWCIGNTMHFSSHVEFYFVWQICAPVGFNIAWNVVPLGGLFSYLSSNAF